MTQATNKTERFADYINKMNFSEVIEFFNFMMEDMMQIENHAMYDYHVQKDAIDIINTFGMETFLEDVVYNPTQEERCVMYQIDGIAHSKDEKSADRWMLRINPWTEILDGYSEWIIGHVEDCINGEKNGAYIEDKYPEIFDVVREPKKKIKVAVHKTLTKIVEIDANSFQEACTIINSNFEDYDPLKACDLIGDYFTEIVD